MLPVYIYYSMFGFQRVGDLIWAAADQRSRGFLFGATAGRTTLGGEGLQHQDGSSLLVASTIPNCRAWDPAHAGEVAVILEYGMKRMLVEQQDEFHYLTLMNENYAMPSLPESTHADLLKGLYRLQVIEPTERAERKQEPLKEPIQDPPTIRLLGSGAILREVLIAAHQLADQHGITCEVFSATSYSELAREACVLQRLDQSEPLDQPRASHVATLLAGEAPIIAASDYVRAWPQLIAEYLEARMITLGTDGFGRSDTRQQLRRYFEVDADSIVQTALQALVRYSNFSKVRSRDLQS
jgi:pyruvate dehydrogenase E1 component